MNQDTTIQESRMPFLHGWLGSIALHGLMFLSLFPLFRQSLITIHNEPFHWNVALVQSTPTAHASVQTADTTTTAVLKQPDLTATASHTKRTTHQTTPSAQRITSFEPKAEVPVTPTSMPDSPLSVTSPNELPLPLVQAHEPPRQPTDTQSAQWQKHHRNWEQPLPPLPSKRVFDVLTLSSHCRCQPPHQTLPPYP